MHLILTLLFLVILFRIVLRALGFGRWHGHRHFRGGGWGNGFGNGFNGGYGNGNGYGGQSGYGRPFGYGSRRGGGLFTILALVALDRIIGRRW